MILPGDIVPEDIKQIVSLQNLLLAQKIPGKLFLPKFGTIPEDRIRFLLKVDSSVTLYSDTEF
jgi:hypothetical protein